MITPAASHRAASPIDFFSIGWNLAFLYQVSAGWEINSPARRDSINALETMQMLSAQLSELGVCRSLVPRLTGLTQELRSKYNPGMRLTEQDHQLLHGTIESIYGAALGEIERRRMVEIRPPEGMLDYERLVVTGPESLTTDPSLLTYIPNLVKQDLNDSLRCLAFGLPTPAAIISLRATEGMIRYTFTFLGGGPPGEAWREALDGLNTIIRNRGIEAHGLAGYLDHLRQVRNTASHPEARFALREAEHAFLNSLYSVSALARICSDGPHT